jgi:hypothetical protein
VHRAARQRPGQRDRAVDARVGRDGDNHAGLLRLQATKSLFVLFYARFC